MNPEKNLDTLSPESQDFREIFLVFVNNSRNSQWWENNIFLSGALINNEWKALLFVRGYFFDKKVCLRQHEHVLVTQLFFRCKLLTNPNTFCGNPNTF